MSLKSKTGEWHIKKEAADVMSGKENISDIIQITPYTQGCYRYYCAALIPLCTVLSNKIS